MSEVRLAPGIVLEDDVYAVQTIDERTFAIGEPSYYQQNWSYLLIGETRSLMFDTGSYFGDITGVVSRRVDGPLTAFPSHMHFDHLGNVERFDHVALADLPVLRACEDEDFVCPSEFLFLGSFEDRSSPRFRVSEWLKPGSWIDLGGRRLQILHTPGHSVDSVSLYEPDRATLFAADFLYNGDLYGQTPGADLATYLEVAEGLLERLPEGITIYGAHGNVEEGGAHTAPRMDRSALNHLARALARIRDECGTWDEEPEWRFDVDEARQLLISPEAIAAWRV